jgi:hypothetical protein
MSQDEKISMINERIEKKELLSKHYYGDKIRILYLAMAIIILVMTPFFKERIPVTEYFSIFGTMILSVFAGFTNPVSRLVIYFNFLISIAAFIVFGTETLSSYNPTSVDYFFFGNLLLAIVSIFAVYYSSKTLRGNLLINKV